MKKILVIVLCVTSVNVFAAGVVTKQCPGNPADCASACKDQVGGTETNSQGEEGTGYCTYNPANGVFPKPAKGDAKVRK